MVMWNGGAGGPPFAVVCEHDFFSSHRMVNECGYSHAFGTVGDYRSITDERLIEIGNYTKDCTEAVVSSSR